MSFLFDAPRFRAGWILLALGVFNAGFWAALRWNYERTLSRVQLTVDYEDTRLLADAYGVPHAHLLRELKARGVSSVVVSSQTLSSLRESGLISLASRPEAERLFPKAAWHQLPNSYNLVVLAAPHQESLLRRITRHLREQAQPALPPRLLFTPASAAREGSKHKVASSKADLFGVAIGASTMLEFNASLGFAPSQLEAVHRAGLSVTARMPNPPNLTLRRLRQMLDAARAGGARVVLFEDEVLGHASLVPQTAQEMKNRGLLFGNLEFGKQRGASELAQQMGGQLVRVHSVPEAEANAAKPEVVADRYVRAVRERNIRVALIRLLRQTKSRAAALPVAPHAASSVAPRVASQTANSGDISGRSALDANLEFVAGIAQRVRAQPPIPWSQTFTLGPAAGFGYYPLSWLAPRLGGVRNAQIVRYFGLLASGLGVVGACLLLLDVFFDLKRWERGLAPVGGVAIVAVLAISSNLGARLMALMAAIVFPVVAVLWGGLPQMWDAPARASEPNESGTEERGAADIPAPVALLPLATFRSGCGVLLRTSGLTLCGALLVVALLNTWRFLSKTDDFLGTRPVQLVPLALVAWAFAGGVFPHRVVQEGAAAGNARARARLRRALDGPFTLQAALLSAVLAATLVLWMARTGNDSSLEVPGFEWRLRAVLEQVFFARPRTKEVFLGYPALLLAVWMSARREWRAAWLLAVLATVGQTDLLNTFCQVNNPLHFALWRSIVGLTLGTLAGGAALWALSAGEALWRARTGGYTQNVLRQKPPFAPPLPLTPSPASIVNGGDASSRPESQLHKPEALNTGRRRFNSAATRGALLVGLLALGAGITVVALRGRRNQGVPLSQLDVAAPLTTWPWPGAVKTITHRGVTHWLARSPDGTTLDLFEFDFARNPGLRFQIYDQDEDDAKPRDNRVAYWQRGLGDVVRDLNLRPMQLEKTHGDSNAIRRSDAGRGVATTRNGAIIVACNGLFFGLENRKPRVADRAFHLAPVVLRGRVLFNKSNHRWTLGVSERNAHPTFTTRLLPGRDELMPFSYAAGGAQCLLRDGVPLRLQPYPRPHEAPLVPPVPTGPDEAGHIPSLDHIRTSRVSLGWTRATPAASGKLYLLFVKEPDGETGSRLALARRLPATHRLSRGGWMLSDVQRFWLAMRVRGVTDAINSDGGDVAQLAFRRPDSRYVLVPPRFSYEAVEENEALTNGQPRPTPAPWQPPAHDATQRRVFDSRFAGAPPGGTIMFFVVRDVGSDATTKSRAARHTISRKNRARG